MMLNCHTELGMTNRVLTDQQIIELGDRYVAGESSTSLAREFGISQDTASKWIKRSGIKMRASRDSLSAGLNETYFSIVDEHRAYWLGFISADGHIVVKNGVPTTFRLFLSTLDRDVLEKLVCDINFGGTIKDYVRTRRGKDYYESGIVFNSRQFCGDLDKWGVLDWKNNDPRMMWLIPPEFRRDFVRGLFDGDGCITARQRNDRPSLVHKVTLVDNKLNAKSLEAVESEISDGASVNKNGVKIGSSCCRLVWVGRNQVKRIAEWMYEGATIFMDRKKRLFPGHINIQCGAAISAEERYNYNNWKEIFTDVGECCEWLLDYGFCAPQYKVSVDDIILDIDDKLNANVNKPKITNIIKHFSPHYWYSTHKDYNAVADAWEPGNGSVLKSVIERLWPKKVVNIHTLLLGIARHYKDFTNVSIFKPWVARYIYEKLLPNGGVVIDPCMGWGGRLIGCMDLNINYIGYDLNPNVIKSHNVLREFLGDKIMDSSFEMADSTTVDFPDGDLIFTSPPYDNTELYYGIDSHNTKSMPIYENIFNKFNGIIALNIPLRHVDCINIVADRRGYKIIDEFRMTTTSFMGRERTYEPILVFGAK